MALVPPINCAHLGRNLLTRLRLRTRQRTIADIRFRPFGGLRCAALLRSLRGPAWTRLQSVCRRPAIGQQPYDPGSNRSRAVWGLSEFTGGQTMLLGCTIRSGAAAHGIGRILIARSDSARTRTRGARIRSRRTFRGLARCMDHDRLSRDVADSNPFDNLLQSSRAVLVHGDDAHLGQRSSLRASSCRMTRALTLTAPGHSGIIRR
jgi:hypothetical protein